MSDDGLDLARIRMTEAGVPGLAIDAFARLYGELEAGASGMLAEADVRPLVDVEHVGAVEADDEVRREALARTVVVKLNGGLGTSMGMDRAKSLLPVRGEASFLDVIAEQVLTARARYGVSLPLVLMNSFRTRDDSLAALSRHRGLAVDGPPADFLQNREPKLRADDLTPVSWPDDPDLEWCPPGHGDLYTALQTSGLLDQLLAAGYRYASVSNADNLGAAPDATIAAWFAASGAPFAAEVARRTPADRKGGHLVVRRSDGRLVLRETAQTRSQDERAASDISRHRYFNTNNLWLDLAALAEALRDHDGVLPLPLIRNSKTVDPTDPGSTPVIQIETAMGAAIEVFDGARVLEVDRSRFLPVKTTDDLLVVRSDVYTLDDDARLVARTAAPFVELDGVYKLLAGFDQRFPAGPPSLVDATSLRVSGDWTFGSRVRVVGEGVLSGGDGVARRVPDGATVTERGLG